MSKFIPAIVVQQEQFQQQIRRINGLKSGTHVYFPYSEIGPYIIRKSVLENMTDQERALWTARAHAMSGTKPDSLAEKVKKKFRKLFRSRI